MANEIPLPIEIENHFLLFKTYHGVLLGWNILTPLLSEDIDDELRSATDEWLSEDEGKQFVQKEKLDIYGMDYAHVLMNIPPEILAKHHIYPGTPVCEIIELGWDENLLPEELKHSESLLTSDS